MKKSMLPGRLMSIRLTMIAVQLLLVGFVIHWLNLQYMEKEHELLSEIDQAWMDSRQQMIDSMLMKEYINPAFDSTKKFDFRFEFNTDSIRNLTRLNEDAILNNMPLPVVIPAKKSKIIVKVTDSLSSDRKENHQVQRIMTRDLVLQGVKLFVNEVADSSGNITNISSTWTTTEDTVMIKKTFIDKMQLISPLLKVKWRTKRNDDRLDIRPFENYRIESENGVIYSSIDGYSKFIWRKLLPQMALGMVLLLMTALAFIFSLRSLKAQILLNTERNDFIRNMSHELKTPVSTVKVTLEALRKFDRKNDPQLMDEYLDMATAEANRLELLIGRVMSISENGDALLMSPSDINPNEVVEHVIRAMKPRLDEEGAQLVIELAEDDCILNIDPLYIQGVIMNLIDNSLKYSQKPAYIKIVTRKQADHFAISVTDHGIGIPQAYREKIFEKFFRVPTGDTHNVKGYGLGLTYAYTVMKLHNGMIRYLPGEEKGSCFELIFPFKV
jgi:signal transduction histidine kinase